MEAEDETRSLDTGVEGAEVSQAMLLQIIYDGAKELSPSGSRLLKICYIPRLSAEEVVLSN